MDNKTHSKYTPDGLFDESRPLAYGHFTGSSIR